MHVCYYQLAFIILATFLAIGPLNAIITVQTSLCNRNFFSDCTNSSKQSAFVARATNFALSAMNGAALPAGILVDSGAWKAGVVAAAGWTFGISICGLSQELFWVGLTIASIAVSLCFSSIVFFHIRHASVIKRYALWIAALTCLRNASCVMNIPLALLLDVDRVPVPVVFLIYGCGVGLPLVVGFWALFPQRLHVNQHDCGSHEHLQLIAENPALDTFSGIAHEEEEEDDGDDDDDDVDVEEGQAEKTNKKKSRIMRAGNAAFLSFKVCAREPLFYLLLVRSIVLVTISYFLSSSIGSVAMLFESGTSSSNDDKDTQQLLRNFNYLMVVFSVVALLPGQLAKKWGPLGLAVQCALSALLVVCWCGAMLFGRNILPSSFAVVSLVSYGGAVAWRVAGFAVLNLSTPVLLSHLMADPKQKATAECNRGKAAPGVVFGAQYSIGGLASLALGGTLTHVVSTETNDETVIRNCVAVCGAVALALDLCLLVVILYRHQRR